MISKTKDRELAITLRKQGFSYSQILAQVPVARSTLSLWLQSVALSKPQKQRLTQKRIAAALRGAHTKRQQRIDTTSQLVEKAKKEIKTISKREMWLLGIALYWAEGSKQKEGYYASAVIFSNSDLAMVRFFKAWLERSLGIDSTKIKFEIYLHETSKFRLQEVRKYWAQGLGLPLERLNTIYFKKGNLVTTRKNVGNGYYGQVRIRVRRSTELNRSIAGWIQGIVQNCRFV